MKYFEILYKTSPQVYEFDSPIYLVETAIIKDTVDNQILLRNTMRNVTNEKIIAVMLNIIMKDIFGELVCGTDGKSCFQYIYQDISFGKGELFGNKIAINLPETVRKVEVTVEKVVLESGVVWKSTKKNFAQLQKQKEIHEPDVFMNMVEKEMGVQSLFYYMENDTCWQCTCGQPNKIESTKCINCGLDKQIAKEHLSEKKLEEKYYKYLQEEKKVTEKKENVKEQKSKNNDKNMVNGSVQDHIQNKKNSSKKRKLTLVDIVIIVVLLSVCLSLYSERTYDKKAASVLAKGVEKRSNLPESGDKEENFEELVYAEEKILKLDQKKFKNEDFQLYIQGVNKQKESLDYFENDQNRFWKLWNEGENIRCNSIINLVKNNDLKISDKAYSKCAINVLTNEIGNKISGSVHYSWDEIKNQYYYENSFKNVTDLYLNNVVLNLSFGNEVNTCSTKAWGPDADWNIKMYMSQDTIDAGTVDLDIEFVKYQYKDVFEDNSATAKKETKDIVVPQNNYSNISEMVMEEAMEEYRKKTDSEFKHTCEVNSCNKEGIYGIEGISGNREYYCAKHYNEMKNMLENMQK